MGDLAEVGSTAGPDEPATADATSVVRRAEELLAEGDTRSAREAIREALGTLGRRADLLWVLADTEFAEEDLTTAQECLEEALAVSPNDPVFVARQMQVLRGNGLWRAALSATLAFPPDVRTDRLVRTEAGNLYRLLGCPAHAVDGYGPGHDLSRSAKTARRWCWLRSGGPIGILRQRTRAREQVLLRTLRHPDAYINGISEVDGLEARHARRVQSQLETWNYQYQKLFNEWVALQRAGYRLAPLVVIPIWLVLLTISRQAGFIAGSMGPLAFAAISAAISTVPVIMAVLVILQPNGDYRFEPPTSAVVIFLLAVIAVEAAAGDAYASHLLPTAGLSAAFILGLVATPATVACLPIAAILIGIRWIVRFRRLIRRYNGTLAAVDSLLIVLYGMKSHRDYCGIRLRIYYCQRLEFAASRLAKDLLPRSSVNSLGSAGWLERRTAGWAEAVRHVQRQVIASLPGGGEKQEGFLCHEIRCLATGDLGALAWREPPPPSPPSATLRQQAISVVRAIVVAGIPLGAVLAAQPFLHASTNLFDWARIATGIWALLYVLLSIDPAIRDKIGAARDLADLIQSAPRPTGHDEGQKGSTL